MSRYKKAITMLAFALMLGVLIGQAIQDFSGMTMAEKSALVLGVIAVVIYYLPLKG